MRDDELPNRLSDAVKEACASRIDAEELGGAVWTIFAELIQNTIIKPGRWQDAVASRSERPHEFGVRVPRSCSYYRTGVSD